MSEPVMDASSLAMASNNDCNPVDRVLSVLPNSKPTCCNCRAWSLSSTRSLGDAVASADFTPDEESMEESWGELALRV